MTRRKRRALIGLLGLGLLGIGGALALRAPLTLVGQPAPDFSLPDQEGTAAHLADQRGKWVVLVFYPKDSSRACTLQNRAFSDQKAAFDRRNAVVWGISTGDLAAKRAFCAANRFTHRLLADKQGAVARAYRSALPLPGIAIANRVTVIVDPSGKIASVELVTRPSTDDTETLRRLDLLQSG